MKILILLLAGIACLWFFGKAQPIVVIDHAVTDNRLVSCSKCGGTGSVEVQATCPKCNGTGKGEWHFKSKDKKTSFESKPACLSCRGAGKTFQREKCPQCQGAGRAAVSESQKTRTVRADLSLWEKILAWCLIKPDKNCRPQRKLDGSYPLISKYIEIMASPAYNIRVIEWGSARLEAGEWIVKAVIEFKDKNGQWVQQCREFIVQNREVKSTRVRGQGSEVSRQE